MPTGLPHTTQTLSGDEFLVLPEFDDPHADPVALLGHWLADAEQRAVREPRAIVLATADATGRASSRVVLLKELAEGALVFTSHRGSRKGLDLATTPWASATFYWRETLQQINVAGPVEPLSEAESDALFAERPLAAQATTAVSVQSTPLSDEENLHARARQLVDRGTPLPRPDGWSGYRLIPETIEFWQGRTNRLHRRLQYTRGEAGWTHQRLQP